MSKKDWSHETYTTENTVISADFLVWKFCGKAQFTGDPTEPMRKLCLSTKFPHQEIRSNYGILRSVVTPMTVGRVGDYFFEFDIKIKSTFSFFSEIVSIQSPVYSCVMSLNLTR